MTTQLRELRPGTRFRFPWSGQEGELLRLGPGSATVRLDGTRRKHIEKRRGEEIVAVADFEVPNKPAHISLGTTVEALNHRNRKGNTAA